MNGSEQVTTHLKVGMGTFMVHGGDNFVASQGIIYGSLSHWRPPHVQQESALFPRISDGPVASLLPILGRNETGFK